MEAQDQAAAAGGQKEELENMLKYKNRQLEKALDNGNEKKAGKLEREIGEIEYELESIKEYFAD